MLLACKLSYRQTTWDARSVTSKMLSTRYGETDEGEDAALVLPILAGHEAAAAALATRLLPEAEEDVPAGTPQTAVEAVEAGADAAFHSRAHRKTNDPEADRAVFAEGELLPLDTTPAPPHGVEAEDAQPARQDAVLEANPL